MSIRVGDLVRPRQNTYIGYAGPETLALVIDIARYASVTNVLILAGDLKTWVSASLLEVVSGT